MNPGCRCPQCNAEIPANSPAGLCPRCLLLAANDSQSGAVADGRGPTASTPRNSGFTPPTVEELAAQFPQWEIMELLGKGGMGAVYKARQRQLDRLVAVKILPRELSQDPAFADRFIREARALARLNNPHIVGVYEFGQTSSGVPAGDSRVGLDPPDSRREGAGAAAGLCYFVMEYVEGVTLRQLIRQGDMRPVEALAIIPQICEALQYAHEQGIVHRDIKPENILVDQRGDVKIADFGLAKLLDGDAVEPTLTASHQVMGTLKYMAPEQLEGSRDVDHRADIYSLGVIFYELLTRELPIGRFAPPSKKVAVDVRLDEVVLRALEKEPEQRYQQARDVKSEIDTIRTTAAPAQLVAPSAPLSKRAGTPVAQMQFRVPATADVARYAELHFSSLGYQVVERQPDACVFARGSRWAGLWEVDIRQIATWLTVRTAPAPNDEQWVSCDWSVRTLGAWITRRDIRKLEAEGEGLQTLLGVRSASESKGVPAWNGAASTDTQKMTLAAVGCGFTARAAKAGKIGMIMGAVTLLLGLALVFAILVAREAFVRAPLAASPGKPGTSPGTVRNDQPGYFPQAPISVDRAEESARGWIVTADAARLTDLFAQAVLKLSPDQTARVNQILQTTHRRYLALESQHREQRTDETGHVVTVLQPIVIDKLEDELWAQLDQVLNREQQSIARLNLHLRVPEVRPPISLDKLVQPGLFGWESHGATIEIWQVGSWFHWKVRTRGYESVGQAPDLPAEFARFWQPMRSK